MPLGQPNGIIVRAPGENTVYHMGDTAIFGDMALINELYAPQIGLVPIGDRFTMGADTAALAVRRYFSFETVIPCHYATFGMLDQDANAFTAALDDHPTRVLIPTKGVAVTL